MFLKVALLTPVWESGQEFGKPRRGISCVLWGERTSQGPTSSVPDSTPVLRSHGHLTPVPKPSDSSPIYSGIVNPSSVDRVDLYIYNHGLGLAQVVIENLRPRGHFSHSLININIDPSKTPQSIGH